MPTFPGYVFARFVLGERFAAAHHCTGAAGLVRLGEHFAALLDEVVAAFRQAEGASATSRCRSPRRTLKEGSRVTVTRGPLAGLEGTVTRYLPAKSRVQLLMKAVWAGRRVELDARDTSPDSRRASRETMKKPQRLQNQWLDRTSQRRQPALPGCRTKRGRVL